MKYTIKNMSAKIFLLFFSLLSGVYAMAQDSSSTTQKTFESHSQTTVSTPDATMWYTNPIVWVVGGLVLLIVIILAVRSSSSSSSSTTSTRDGGTTRSSTTTVTKD